MKKYRLLFIISVFYTSVSSIIAQNIVVDDTYTAQQLVQNVLVNSTCANVTNFSVSGDTFSGNAKSYGYFSYSGSAFPFSSGIVLSTSRATRTQGPNSDLIDEGDINWLGDADLEQALAVSGTFNATVLEFDFTPLTDKISFDYLFASEEYQGTAPCRYSDGFAFLLKPVGSTAPYQNLALIPNTTTPVKVTSVHPLIPGNNGCAAENETYFGSYNPTTYPINFNGQTLVMTAKATVIPGQTYHIKLVIADEENIRYDSAIFLDGGSFNVGVDLGADRLIATNNPICFGDTLTLDATLAGSNSYQWFKNGLPIGGATNPTYTVFNAGIYTVEITLSTSTCITTGEIEIEYSNLPLLSNQTLVQCDPDGNGTSAFNLTQLNATITGGNAQLGAVSYYTSLTNAQSLTNPITNLTTFQSSSGNQIFASVANSFGCRNQATVDLIIANNPITPLTPIQKCDTDGNLDGVTNFDWNTEVTPNVLLGLPTGLAVAYYISSNDALSESNPLPANYTTTTPFQQTIYARITNGSDCYGIISVVLQVLVFDPPQLQDQTIYTCNGNPINLSVPNNYASYTWLNGATTNTITATQPGIYSVVATNAFGCQKTKTFTVIDSEVANIMSIEINDFNNENNTVIININGNGSYEFSLDGDIYQDSPVFTNVTPNIYLVYVKDKRGCGIITKQIVVLDYPRFFTPNGDGINDVWYIKNIINQPNTSIAIYDRYGKLVYSFNEKQNGWNGKSNATDVFASDYWFVIEFPNKKIVKGHFSLKR
jgi:gliding motility-associated-like protein